MTRRISGKVSHSSPGQLYSSHRYGAQLSHRRADAELPTASPLVQFLESDLIGVLPEAATADIQPILANESMCVGTAPAAGRRRKSMSRPVTDPCISSLTRHAIPHRTSLGENSRHSCGPWLYQWMRGSGSRRDGQATGRGGKQPETGDEDAE